MAFLGISDQENYNTMAYLKMVALSIDVEHKPQNNHNRDDMTLQISASDGIFDEMIAAA